MSGKKTIIIIIAFTIIALILTWFWLQHVIVKYDIDKATDATNQLMSGITSTINRFNIT